MRILFVTYSRALLGANLSMLSLIKDLRDRYEVEPVVLMSDVKDGDLAEELQKNKIEYLTAPIKHWVISSKYKLKYSRGLWHYTKNIKSLRLLVSKPELKNIDIVYTNNSTVIMGAMIAKKLNKPHFWHIREYGSLHYDYVYDYPMHTIQKWYGRAEKVITVSQGLKDYVDGNIAKKADTVLVYNGICSESEYHPREINNGVLHFAVVGALEEGKNQSDILKAAKILKNKTDSFHIDIIGSGDYGTKLREYTKENGLEDCITFWGFRKDVNDLLGNMDIGVLCSRAEAFGRVTCEYFAHGMPVIGSASGGTPELIDEAEDGYLYQIDNAEDLSKKMMYFIDNRDCIIPMGKKGFEKVNTKYTIKANTDAIYGMLKDAVREK